MVLLCVERGTGFAASCPFSLNHWLISESSAGKVPQESILFPQESIMSHPGVLHVSLESLSAVPQVSGVSLGFTLVESPRVVHLKPIRNQLSPSVLPRNPSLVPLESVRWSLKSPSRVSRESIRSPSGVFLEFLGVRHIAYGKPEELDMFRLFALHVRIKANETYNSHAI